MADIYSFSVVDLLNLDGDSGSTSITDSSYSARTHSVVGAAALSITAAKWGASSLYLPSSGSYVTAPGTTDFVFGTGDFTLECWVKTSTTGKCILDFYGGSGWQLFLTAAGYLQWYTTSEVKTGAISVTDNAWHHVAVTRVSGVVYLFVDGAADGAGVADVTNHATTQTFFTVGAQASTRNAAYDFIGYIDDVRVTKGVGRYNATFAAPTAAFTVDSPNTAILAAPIATLGVFGGGNFTLTAPAATMNAGAVGSANSSLVAPSPTLTVLTGGVAELATPSPTLSAIARDSTGDYAASLTAPRPTLTAFGAATALATAPKPTLASGGTVVAMGSASVASPSVLVQSEGRVSAMVSADLRAPSASLIGYGGAVVSVTLSGKATVEASGTTGGIAGASLECPLFQLSAEATAQNYGSASLIAPSPEIGRTVQAWVAAPAARLTAIGTAVVTATFDAYVVNLMHRGGSTVDEVTHYTNFPFTHVVRYQNSYYGVNSTGLYLLEGTTDDGDPIEWAVQTAMEDFGSPRRKTVDSVYIEGRLGAATTVSLQSGEKTPNTYSHTTPRGATAQNHRQKLGRGVKERYHALGLAGDGEFELDAVEFNERETNRRI